MKDGPKSMIDFESTNEVNKIKIGEFDSMKAGSYSSGLTRVFGTKISPYSPIAMFISFRRRAIGYQRPGWGTSHKRLEELGQIANLWYLLHFGEHCTL